MPALQNLCVVLLVALTGCSVAVIQPTPTPVPEIPPPSAPVFTAQRGLVIRQIQFTARVQPLESSALHFEIDGKVRRVAVRGGDKITKDQVLAELDLTDLRTQIQQTQIQLRAAEQVLSETLTGYTRTLQLAFLDMEQARLKYDAAAARLTTTNKDVVGSDLARQDQSIADLRETIRAAQAASNPTGAENGEKLLKNALIDREKIAARLKDINTDLGARSIELTLLKNEMERARLNYDAKSATVDPAKIQAVETARVQLTALRAKELRGSLIAPFDGEVVNQPLQVGDNVKALDDTMIVAKPGDVEVVASVSESQLRELSVGQPISLSLAAFPNQLFPAVIRRVPLNTSTDKDRFVRIQIESDLRKTNLETGMLARCTTELARRENVVWLPPQAVRNFRGRRYVIVQEPGGKQRRVDVIVGLESLERVEVMDGLQGHETVVGQN